MNHRIKVQAHFSLVALTRLPLTEAADLFDRIAENFGNLSPDIRAAALNAATAQRAADDYRAALAAALGAPDSDPAAPASDRECPACKGYGSDHVERVGAKIVCAKCDSCGGPMMQQVPDGITQDATGPAETHTMEDACQMAFTQYADGRAGRGLCALEYHEFRGVWQVAMQLRLSAAETQARLRVAESRLCHS